MYQHFSKSERCEIAILLKKGYSIRDIGNALNRNPSSVSREITNNSVNGRYDPVKAQHKAYTRRKYSKYQGMRIRDNPEIERYIAEKMRVFWSPEQIAGRMRLERGKESSVHFKTIYQYLYHPTGQPLCQYLRYKQHQRRKRKGKKSPREIIKNRVFIDQRPKVVNQRRRFGDFEGDTMGVPRGSKTTIAAVIERKSRHISAQKISSLKEAMNSYRKLIRPIRVISRSFTLDNGSENAQHLTLRVKTYFCHPYSAWEKGAIENALGLIREFIPKKTKLDHYSDAQIGAIIELINNQPRKCLGFRTPKEVFEEQIRKVKCCT